MNNKDLRIDPKVFLWKAEHTICIISFDLEPRKPRTDEKCKTETKEPATAGLNQTTSTQGQGRSSGSKWRIVLWTASMNESITSPLLFQGQFSDIVFLWPQRVTMLPLLWQCSVWKQSLFVLALLRFGSAGEIKILLWDKMKTNLTKFPNFLLLLLHFCCGRAGSQNSKEL